MVMIMGERIRRDSMVMEEGEVEGRWSWQLRGGWDEAMGAGGRLRCSEDEAGSCGSSGWACDGQVDPAFWR
jgi:hypothetical protein